MADFQELTQFLAKRLPKPKFLVQNLIIPNGKVFIFGREGSFKSSLAKQMCLDIASGEDFLGFGVDKSHVAMYQAEVYEPLWQERVAITTRYYQGLPSWKNRFCIYMLTEYAPGSLEQDEGLNDLVAKLRLLNPKPELLILDPLASFFLGSERDDEKVKRLTHNIGRLMTAFNLAVVFIHHQRKAREMEFQGAHEMRGSTVFSAWADTILHLKIDDPEAGELTLQPMKTRFCAPLPRIKLKLNEEYLTLEVIGMSQLREEIEERVIDFLRGKTSEDAITTQEITAALGVYNYSLSSIHRALGRLEQTRILKRQIHPGDSRKVILTVNQDMADFVKG